MLQLVRLNEERIFSLILNSLTINNILNIIILLILAGVIIITLSGGLLEKTKLAKQKWQETSQDENSKLEDYHDLINNEGILFSNSRDISTDINDFTPIIGEINGTYIEVKVPEIDTINNVKIVGYAYAVNGKVKKITEEKSVILTDLDYNKEYKLEVYAIDENMKIKKSAEKNPSTMDKLYLYKEGSQCTPITGGWIEWSNSQGGYNLNEDNCLSLKCIGGYYWGAEYLRTNNTYHSRKKE